MEFAGNIRNIDTVLILHCPYLIFYCRMHIYGVVIIIYIFEGMHGGYDPDLIPNESFMRRWVRIYLEECAKLEGTDPSEVTDRDVEVLFVQVMKFTLVCYMIYYLCVIIRSKAV